MVNGVVVADTTNVNGQVTNCIVTAEGKTICVNPPTSSVCSNGSNSYFTCLQPEPTTAFPNPLKVPISDAVQTVSKIAKVATNLDINLAALSKPDSMVSLKHTGSWE
jgi:hypothetical protein